MAETCLNALLLQESFPTGKKKKIRKNTMSPQPKKRPLSEIRPEIEAARLEGDHMALQQLLVEGSRHGRCREEFLLPMARLYEELAMPREALIAWQASFAEKPNLEAAYQILRHGGQMELSLIEETFSNKARAAIEDLLRHGPTTGKENARHLAICGISYSGSTLLGRLIDGLSDFRDIGESHWLINQRQAAGMRRQIDFFASPPSPSRSYCRQCGETCEVLSTTFRIEMQLHRSQWYTRIAERLNTDILVSSDKNSAKYVILDPLLRFDAVTLFKSPGQAWQSYWKRLSTPDSAEVQIKLEQFMKSWIRGYKNLLRMKPRGKKLFLHFDTLVNAPEQTLACLLETLGLPMGELDIEMSKKGCHAIGGNDRFIDASRNMDLIDIRPQEEIALPHDHLRMIAGNATISTLFDELLSRSEAQFGRI